MARGPFRFKQFSISDNRCAHKVGTDGVLLGCWVDVLDTDRMILDVGTGSGVIALMMAQRSEANASVHAIEIEARDVAQARENAVVSPWPGKIEVIHGPVQQYAPAQQYDLIVSNPPYFSNSLLPPDPTRSGARHTHSLSFSALLESAFRLLAGHGRLGVILPYEEGDNFTLQANDIGLFARRRTTFRSRAHKPEERLLLEFSRSKGAVDLSEITLYRENETWTDEYRALTRDFYLHT